jgi:DNA modification methylase
MRYKIINSDVYAGLYSLQDNLIDLAVTSPPYWGQRDYGFKGQIGNEDTYQEYIYKLIKIFSLLREKLTPEGVFFLNIGDKYLSKYGKSPLGFIPYQLAYLMIEDGWILNEILIWYKPNHMPSSIKNRFANSYEPVFAFSKNTINIYTKKNTHNNRSNILKINLQPTPYKHVAVYPEKLVDSLLKMVVLQDNITVLDPFAGSGTTLKVTKDNNKTINAIMIENHTDYIDIIKERCNLNGQFEILKYDFIPYKYHTNNSNNQLTLFEKNKEFKTNKIINKNRFIKIYNNKLSYYNLLEQFYTNTIKNYLNSNATCFIGCKEFDIELIYKTSLLNNKGWVIRNMIIIEDKKHWFPVFMIVDDNKKTKYIFNYKNLKLKSKTEYQRDWNLSNFIGYRVFNSIDKIKKEGKIIEILQKKENGFPEYVIVEWEDNTFTKEFVIYSQEEINQNIIFKDNFSINESKPIISFNNHIQYKKSQLKKIITNNITNNNYNGKFKNEKRKNWGASPGARSSVEQEYFSTQRLYEVNQNYIADYLNYKRIQKGLSKQDLTSIFPKNYKHTVGHWLRKDFGGSIPTPTDWSKLSEILDIDSKMTNYVCKTALKIQTVKNAEFKIPDDFLNINSLSLFDKLFNDNTGKHMTSQPMS